MFTGDMSGNEPQLDSTEFDAFLQTLLPPTAGAAMPGSDPDNGPQPHEEGEAPKTNNGDGVDACAGASLHFPSALLHFPSALLHFPSASLHFPSASLHFPSACLHCPSASGSTLFHQPLTNSAAGAEAAAVALAAVGQIAEAERANPSTDCTDSAANSSASASTSQGAPAADQGGAQAAPAAKQGAVLQRVLHDQQQLLHNLHQVHRGVKLHIGGEMKHALRRMFDGFFEEMQKRFTNRPMVAGWVGGWLAGQPPPPGGGGQFWVGGSRN